jgi:alkylation response protein AidB-like acyl-CoA dehydrogenase
MFLDDVEIPARNLIGKENDGWRIAQTTLSAERGLFIFNLIEKLERALNRDLTAGNSTWFGDDQLRREFSLLYARMRGVRAMVRKMLAEIESNPDMAASMMTTFIKLVWATLLQDYTEFVLRAEGIDGQALEPPIWGGGHNTGLRMNDFLRSYAWTISGGTNEIMRNIIAERVLGMPKGV